ncbi:MAG TPA: zinc-binding alcohol dehydrogenase family protein [Lacisediminihabitans sp.]|nr:zinc-binding alcohol dehydrogenase family protein [Lacisediminihabitans sp.]HXD62443.1 zinc-binding alcohol dehydrogenase family protein [Lacisediminihabitans sp.]
MTSTMTAVVASAGPISEASTFREIEVPLPELRPRDLLVRVEAVSVNPVDTKRRRGLANGASARFGFDAAGTVAAVGAEVSGFAIGDEVYYAGDITREGTNADFHAVDERIVGHKPSTLDFAAAAALPLTTITAWESLFEKLRLDADSRGALLVVSGAGGVGSILTQLARVLTGVTIVATASRPESREFAARMGAHHVVDHSGDLASAVRAVAPDGVRWVFSPQTAGHFNAFAELLQPFGELVTIDGASGLDTSRLVQTSITWHQEWMFTRAKFETPDMGEQGRLLDAVAGLVDDGRVVSTLTTRLDGFSPDNLRRAHELVESGRSVGKVVVAR